MEFKKKFENGREVIGVITVTPRDVVILNLYLEYQTKKKTIFWWKKEMITERFSVFSKSTELKHVNTWTKADFEHWVEDAIKESEERTIDYQRNQIVAKLINEQ